MVWTWERIREEMRTLNKIVGWDNVKGLVFEADPCHTEIIVEQLRLTDARLVATPGTEEEGTSSIDHDL